MPCKNPRGRKLAPPPPGWGKNEMILTATRAMDDAGLPKWDIQTMQTHAERARSVMGALRAIAKWVDLGMPEKF